jgi:hypothetical protein
VTRHDLRLVAAACMAVAACTDVSTDPNAVVAVRFDGSPYPSIVVGDSLRDSLGALQPLRATGLNYKGAPVAGAQFVFSSPDTALRLLDDGNVFGRSRKADTPARVFATIGSLQSQPDSLFVVQRADSMAAIKDVDTVEVITGTGGSSAPSAIGVKLFGDTATGKPKAPVPGWLVSFRLRYRGTIIQSTDTSYAFMFETNSAGTVRLLRFVDTTDASGSASRRVFVRSLSPGVTEDTIIVVATMRQRKAGTVPITAETTVLLRPKANP